MVHARSAAYDYTEKKHRKQDRTAPSPIREMIARSRRALETGPSQNRHTIRLGIGEG